MTEYFIKLPASNTIHKPNLANSYQIDDNVQLALSAFDTDGKQGLSSDELLSAFDYFVNKEKEIAISGKKGDRLISNKDIEQIVKTDSKFEKIREKINDDNRVIALLYNVVETLSAIVVSDETKQIGEINENNIYAIIEGSGYQIYNSMNRSVAIVKLKENNINGAKVKIYKASDGEEYVTTADGRKYVKEYAAKYLGYKTEKTWLGFGEDKYYTYTIDKPKRGGDYSENKQYKIWDDTTNSFKNGETEYMSDWCGRPRRRTPLRKKGLIRKD